MARPLRIHIPGRAYHIFGRGNNKACIFREAGDHQHFMELFAESLARFSVEGVASCLLWNHYHLLVVPWLHSVSRLMHHLNSNYCRWFNKKHGRVGHVLQGRFGSTIVDDAAYMMSALRYIAMNPVAAGLVKHPADWQWSSYRATAGLDRAPDWLKLDRVWSAFNCTDPEQGRARYLGHVAEGGSAEELTKALLFGGELLARRIAPLLVPHQHTIAYTYGHRFATRPPLDEIFHGAASLPAIQAAAAHAFHAHGYTLGEIGMRLGRDPSTVCRWIKAVRTGRARTGTARRLKSAQNT